MLLQILIVLVALLVGLYLYTDPKKRGSNLPPIENNGTPLLGAMLSFSKNPVKTIREAYEKHGDLFTLHLVGFNMTYAIGPQASEVFFKATDKELSPKEAYKFTIPVFGPGVVFDSTTELMYQQLGFIKGGLAPSQMKKYVPTIVGECKDFFEKWGQSGEVDFLEKMNNLTILTASRCLLAKEIREDPKVGGDFARFYHDLEGGLNPLAFFFPYIPIPAHNRRDAARVEVGKLFSKIIKARRNLPEEEKPVDMLQNLMESQYKNGEVLTDDQIAGMLVGILFAGQHTSSITATWTGYNLCRSPQYKAELIAEQKQLIEEFGEEITFESLQKSVKLEAAIRETLRMYPPLIILMRKVLVPMQYKNYTIPAGDLLCVSPSVSMMLPNVYKEPETFNPHRFDEEQADYSYLAFGGGKHRCPGEKFGLMQIKTIWTFLLRSFDLELIAKEFPVPDYTNLVVGPTPTTVKYTKKSSF